MTAIELMPVADFAGTRNWGYDGVCLYAPSRNYGRPEDLRRVRRRGTRARPLRDPRRRLQPSWTRRRLSAAVQSAVSHRAPQHAVGSGDQSRRRRVGSRPAASSSTTRCIGCASTGSTACAWTRRTRSPTAARSTSSRRSSTPCALPRRGRWRSTPRIPATLPRWSNRSASAAGASTRSGPTISITSCGVTLRATRTATTRTSPARPTRSRGRSSKAGSSPGSTRCMRGRARGSDPSHVPLHRSIVCLQNHDQIGNRATGDRLHHRIDPAAWRAATTILLTAPMTPLIFMGQEWAASSPFQYFTDLERDLGALVTAGRRYEFRCLSGLCRSRGARSDPGSAGEADVRGERARLGGARARTSIAGRSRSTRRCSTCGGASGPRRRRAPRGDAVAIDPGAMLVRRERPASVSSSLPDCRDPIRCDAAPLPRTARAPRSC